MSIKRPKQFSPSFHPKYYQKYEHYLVNVSAFREKCISCLKNANKIHQRPISWKKTFIKYRETFFQKTYRFELRDLLLCPEKTKSKGSVSTFEICSSFPIKPHILFFIFTISHYFCFITFDIKWYGEQRCPTEREKMGQKGPGVAKLCADVMVFRFGL